MAQPRGSSTDSSAITTVMVVAAVAWTLLVLGGVIVTHTVSAAKFCDVVTVHAPFTTRYQSHEGPTPAGDDYDSTTTDGGTRITTTCSGLGVPMTALLLVPGLLLFAPALTSFGIAGVVTMQVRQIKRDVAATRETVEVAAKKQEETDQLKEAGRDVQLGAEQAVSGAKRPFSQVISGVGVSPVDPSESESA